MFSRARHLLYAAPLLAIPVLRAEPRPLQALTMEYTAHPTPLLMVDRTGPWALALRLIHLGFLLFPAVALYPLSHLSDALDELWCRVVRQCLEAMGPCFVKLGQYGATRNDLLPDRLCQALTALHGAVSPHAFAHTKRTVEQDLGKPLAELFESFDPEPLGSGSIAQVHRGVLRETGQEVAVKVCHPGVREAITRDYECIQWLAKMAAPACEWMGLPEQARQFGHSLSLQVDLRKEAENLELFNHYFEGTERVRFPVPYVSTQRVLVESLEHCNPIEDYYVAKPPPIKSPELRSEVAKIGVEAYFQMLLTDNFFHCDLHPGNMKYREAPTGNAFVLLDTAIVQSLTQREQQVSVQLMLALMQKDGPGAAGCLLSMDSTHKQRYCPDPKAFASNMDDLFRRSLRPRDAPECPWYAPLAVWERLRPQGERYADVGILLRDTLGLVRQHRVRIDPPFASLLFSTILLADMASKVDPDFDLLAHGSSWFFYSALGGIKRRV